MLSSSADPVAVFAAVFATLYAAHQVADHWVQTDHQAGHKGLPGWVGRWNCVKHVATYTATGLAALVLMLAATGLRLDPWAVAAGLVTSAVSHYIADRRAPLRRLAEATGSAAFFTLGMPRPGRDDNPSLGTGAYALDQSWHIWWLFVSALVCAL